MSINLLISFEPTEIKPIYVYQNINAFGMDSENYSGVPFIFIEYSEKKIYASKRFGTAHTHTSRCIP